MKRFVACCALSVLFPIAAHAYEGYVVADVNLRAGPDVGYPPITMLPAGAPVAIQGCVQGWTWCDVIAGYNRGWVAGTYLQEAYGGNPVIVTDYGASIGIPVVAFSIGAYWGHYYRDRPWYHDRVRWEHQRWGYRAPPRPTGWNSGSYHAGVYSGQVRGAVTTPTHRVSAGYRTTGTTHYRTAATTTRVQQRPPVNSRPFNERSHAYAQQRAATRAVAAQPRAVAHATANAPRAHAQQARATEGHGRAVHQANARSGDKRDHGNDQH
ncbi:MAG TPA: SH3 domain-containing protein [Rhodanobacteraceae bacterium]|nr:SH3 domain-containing protein [Rhodanobacteraceae bacterium]